MSRALRVLGSRMAFVLWGPFALLNLWAAAITPAYANAPTCSLQKINEASFTVCRYRLTDVSVELRRVDREGRPLASMARAVRHIRDQKRRPVLITNGGMYRDDLSPVGYYVEYGGQFESQQSATRLIILLAGVAIVGMFLVLLILFPSVRIVLQILNALPTAFIGGVLALVVTQQNLTVASLVGFISLGGIAVRNGILLVTHYFHLMSQEGEGFTQEMILRGSLERLAPVLMTALTAGIGLIPLVVGGQEPGREILYPVATVILGGLTTSTFCEFLIHPGLFWKFSGHDAKRLTDAEEVTSI